MNYYEPIEAFLRQGKNESSTLATGYADLAGILGLDGRHHEAVNEKPATLIKLSKTQVDEQRLILAKMQEQLAAVLQRIAELEIEQEQQRQLIHEDFSLMR